MGLVPRVVALVHLQLHHATVRPPALRAREPGRRCQVACTVATQPALRLETLAAQGTLVGLLAAVNRHMALQQHRPHEAVAADGAKVSSLPRVDADVPLQLGLVQVQLAAVGAVQGRVLIVLLHVHLQLTQGGEGVVAPGARVRVGTFEFLVLQAVLLEVGLDAVALDATGTLVGSFVHVTPEVDFKRRQP